MFGNRSHKINILESPISTISSAGHWFFATRDSIEEYVPGILKKISFESLIRKAITWVDSADSISMLMFLGMAFLINPWIAAAITLLFHYFWYFNKSAFVNLTFTPLFIFLNNEILQLIAAGVALSFLGINGMYAALGIGIIFFFLFKIGLLRRLWDKIDRRRTKNGKNLPLNDRVLKMLIIRYSIYEDIAPSEVRKLENHVQQAVIDFNQKKKK